MLSSLNNKQSTISNSNAHWDKVFFFGESFGGIMFNIKIHHLGIATTNIPKAIEFIAGTHDIIEQTPIVMDPHQQVELCLLTTRERNQIELVSGETVKNLTSKGISYYHVCYEVDNIELTIDNLTKKSCILVRKPTPAILFYNRRVCFMYSPIGLIELLESK
jgi:methylmalonyl-CoA/ethylmalonyl-CoA epimerase